MMFESLSIIPFPFFIIPPSLIDKMNDVQCGEPLKAVNQISTQEEED